MKIALLFPGQGAQYVGMGKSLYDSYTWVRELYDAASEICKKDMKKLCFFSDIDNLTKTNNAQISIFLNSYINYITLKKRYNLNIAYMAGHSLGEFTALAAAGVLSFEEMLKLVKKRGEIMQSIAVKDSGSMLAVRADIDTVVNVRNKILEDHPQFSLEISNYNSANQVVLSGNQKMIDIAELEYNTQGVMTTRLKVGAAFHSKLMKEPSYEFNSYLQTLNLKQPQCRVISNVTGRPYEDNIIEGLSKQMVSTVQWYQTMEYLEEQKVSAYIDLGPQKILKGLCKRNLRKQVFSFEEDMALFEKEIFEKFGL